MATPKEAYEAEFLFRCEDHPDEEASVNIYWIVQNGTPSCDCGRDMKLVGPDEDGD